MSVDTKSVQGRRIVKFNCINCLKADLDRIQSAHDAGTLKTIGNWTAGQILQHDAKLITFAMDGFPSKAPWFVKLFFQLFVKRRALKDIPMDPGYTLPKQAAFMLPDDDVSFEQGMADMRAVVARIDAGDQMHKPSPIFGTITHPQWMGMMLRHTAIHHSFITID